MGNAVPALYDKPCGYFRTSGFANGTSFRGFLNSLRVRNSTRSAGSSLLRATSQRKCVARNGLILNIASFGVQDGCSKGHLFAVRPSSLLEMRDQIQAEDRAEYVTFPKSPGQNADGIASCGTMQCRHVWRHKDVSQPAYSSKIRPDI